MNLENNWEEFKKELNSTKRKGVDALLVYLETTDAKTCPASTKFHLCVEGGYIQHSLNVLKFARLANKEMECEIADEQLIVGALLHDLCKVNYYIKGEEWDKEYKEKTNQWRKKEVWKISDDVPLGHGEKSVIVALPYMDLQPDEMAAIRWHMLKWDVGEANFRTMSEAMDKFTLVKVIAIADQMAEHYETVGTQREKRQQDLQGSPTES